MKQETIVAAVIGLLVGILATGFGTAIALNSNHAGMMSMHDNHKTSNSPGDHSGMSMNDMTKELSQLQGDDFDQAYLEMMIAHHEGAIDMAELAATNAKHNEIKTLSTQIIDAQAKEISNMQQWQTEWGYGVRQMHMMSHQ
jgi:uncharacterized protein (DUF305 family)